jgi:hypothetical protein
MILFLKKLAVVILRRGAVFRNCTRRRGENREFIFLLANWLLGFSFLSRFCYCLQSKPSFIRLTNRMRNKTPPNRFEVMPVYRNSDGKLEYNMTPELEEWRSKRSGEWQSEIVNNMANFICDNWLLKISRNQW